jgi:hypothetical protein
MMQKPIQILFIGKEDNQFLSLKDLFTHMEDLSFSFEREMDLQRGEKKSVRIITIFVSRIINSQKSNMRSFSKKLPISILKCKSGS